MRFLLPLLLSAIQAQAQSADLVLLHGKIITVDSADRIAQAIAIRGQRIVAVGTDAEVHAITIVFRPTLACAEPAVRAALEKASKRGEWAAAFKRMVDRPW